VFGGTAAVFGFDQEGAMFGDLKHFLSSWDWEAKQTVEVLKTLPESKYDFRPDPEGRSLGELAWHLAETDAYMTYMIERGGFQPSEKPPGIERPRTVAALAPGYERIHADAVERVSKLGPSDLDRKVKFFDGSDMSVRMILDGPLLRHLIHHRGQLVMMSRMAGGKPPGVYGPNREETAAMRSRA
jgi:uncharacterized damage-inducible protein DinB